jgi:hypothetical protein
VFAAFTAVALVTVFTGCGGDDDQAAAGREPVTTTVEAVTAASGQMLPAELVGTYEAEREGPDFPSGLWKLAIGPRGEFFLVPPDATGFFNSPVTIGEGKTLVVPAHYESGCTADGRYSYSVTGDGPGGSLTLKATDDVCETRASLLSASWKMTD